VRCAESNFALYTYLAPGISRNLEIYPSRNLVSSGSWVACRVVAFAKIRNMKEGV
jgi:hypothetical protein